MSTRQARRAADRALAARVRAHRPTDAGTAKHEAAHAVACALYGVSFDRVELDILEPHLDLGYARVGGVVDMVFYDPHTAAVVLWAGAAADGHIYNSGHDLQLIERFGAGFVTDRWPGSPHAVSHRLVAAQLSTVDRLAAVLLVERVMTRARVLEVLGNAESPL